MSLHIWRTVLSSLIWFLQKECKGQVPLFTEFVKGEEAFKGAPMEGPVHWNVDQALGSRQHKSFREMYYIHPRGHYW